MNPFFILLGYKPNEKESHEIVKKNTKTDYVNFPIEYYLMNTEDHHCNLECFKFPFPWSSYDIPRKNIHSISGNCYQPFENIQSKIEQVEEQRKNLDFSPCSAFLKTLTR